LNLVGDTSDIIHPIEGTLSSAIGDSYVPRVFVPLVAGPESDAQSQLPEIVNAIHIFGLVLGPAQRREQETRQNRDNSNNHQKLNQGKGSVAALIRAIWAGTPHFREFINKGQIRSRRN
jgi:hypothetical protein